MGGSAGLATSDRGYFPRGDGPAPGESHSLRGPGRAAVSPETFPAPRVSRVTMKNKGLLHALLLLVFTGQVLTAAGFLGEPKLSVAKYIEFGIGEMAVCEVPNPLASENLLINMYLRGEKLSTTQTRNANSETFESTIAPTRPGVYTVECTVSTEDETKRARANVTVYNFPKPDLKIEENMEDYEDDTLEITCKQSEASPATVSLHITVDNTNLTCKDKCSPIQCVCTLLAKKELNGKTVTCEAIMSVLDRVMKHKTTDMINITYAPEFSDDSCPKNQTLIEGNSDTILCKADGNPLPDIVCEKDGIKYNEGRVPHVTRNQSGEYKCRAHNKVDKVLRTVTVSVQRGNGNNSNRPSSGTATSATALAILFIYFI